MSTPEASAEKLQDEPQRRGAASAGLELPQGQQVADGPPQIDDYEFGEKLGSGGFGEVYKAIQRDSGRLVAIKVLRDKHLRDARSHIHLRRFREEADTLSRLDHRGILRILDVYETPEFPFCIVTEYIAAGSLQDRLKDWSGDRKPWPAIREVAEFIENLARTLHVVHRSGIIHRDIKPANILLASRDDLSDSRLADFGLALLQSEIRPSTSLFAMGSPGYMSPEQANGNSQSVTARSDLYSLGVVMFRLLTHTMPFGGSYKEQVKSTADPTLEVPAPRQLRPEIPAELQEICLRALRKKPNERYPSALDMAEALAKFLAELPAAAKSVVQPPLAPVIHRGLRSYEAGDADFFLRLVPGQRDRAGLPILISDWKAKIEERSADDTFRVGVLYGQSGCGKSSLVKAGLLPHLASVVEAVYLEATADKTEEHLLKAIRKKCPVLSANLSLPETLRVLRDESHLPLGKEKILMVLDQFEQWLHGRSNLPATELALALRQCDGGRVQCLLLVRDDFFSSSTADFMNEALGISLAQGKTWEKVKLLSRDDARRNLAFFGESFGKSPPADSPALLTLFEEFLDLAIDQLAENDQVVCVRLALFAQMMEHKPWTKESLIRVGGAEGLGVTFLDETFSPNSPLPPYREHAQAAQTVLESMLPPPPQETRDKDPRSAEQLLQNLPTKYRQHPEKFAELIRILEAETRLITPANVAGNGDDNAPTTPVRSSSSADPAPAKCYQLTHDYLVRSIRNWSRATLGRTKRGRAILLLRERAAQWNATKENRYLPAPLEYAKIRWHTRRRDWTDQAQRDVLRQAASFYGIRFAGLLLLLLVAAVGGGVLRTWILVASLIKADMKEVPALIDQVQFYQPLADRFLKGHLKNPNGDQRLRASLALLPTDPSQAEYLREQLLEAEPENVVIMVRILQPRGADFLEYFGSVVRNPERPDAHVLASAAALAAFDPKNANWNAVTGNVAARLVAAEDGPRGVWVAALQPVANRLITPLARIAADRQRSVLQREVAVGILSTYAAEAPIAADKLRSLANGGLLPDYEDPAGRDVLDVMLETEPSLAYLFEKLFPLLDKRRDDAVKVLQAELKRKLPPRWRDEKNVDEKTAQAIADAKERLAQRQARAAVALLRLDETKFDWSTFHFPSDGDPRLQSYLIHSCDWYAAPAQILFDRLRSLPADSQTEADASERWALIQALGQILSADQNRTSKRFPSQERAALEALLLHTFLKHPDPTVHGSAQWAMRQLGIDDPWQQLPVEGSYREPNGQHWFRSVQGHTLVILDATRPFLIGTPWTEPGRFSNETQHLRRIGRVIAMSACETTRRQFNEFSRERHGDPRGPNDWSRNESDPINGVTFFQALEYCDWLTEKENESRPEGDKLTLVYAPEDGKYSPGMKLPAEYLSRTGYRLPTESEWEFACRAGTKTRFYFGEGLELLPHYSWSGDKDAMTAVARFKPNRFGLFDFHGNGIEWTQSRSVDYPQAEPEQDGLTILEDSADERDIAGILGSDFRILRGGAFDSKIRFLRSGSREYFKPNDSIFSFGFRITRTL